MIYQLGWTTLPGLRGLSVSEFRAAPADRPDSQNGLAIAFENGADLGKFLEQLEAEFAPQRFTNAADAFDTVKAYVVERMSNQP